MNKYEFYNKEKSIIRHNLVPEMLIEIIKLPKPNDYRFGELLFMDDIFDEQIIKGSHFVFKIMNNEEFEDVEDFSLIRSILKRAGKWYKAKAVIGEIKLEKYIPEEILEDDDFKLMKSDSANWWLVAHKESSIIIEFEQGDFNGSQKISELSPISDFMKAARILREVAEWLSINHQNKI